MQSRALLRSVLIFSGISFSSDTMHGRQGQSSPCLDGELVRVRISGLAIELEVADGCGGDVSHPGCAGPWGMLHAAIK